MNEQIAQTIEAPKLSGILMQVFPIDENGFVLWASDRYRMEDTTYEPLPDEVTTPIPTDIAWIQPRWDGTQWVEGKGHPGWIATLYVDSRPEFKTQLPHDGIYWLIKDNKAMPEMVQYLMGLEITESDIIRNSQHLCDTRIVPVLLKMVQALQDRVKALEGQERGLS